LGLGEAAQPATFAVISARSMRHLPLRACSFRRLHSVLTVSPATRTLRSTSCLGERLAR